MNTIYKLFGNKYSDEIFLDMMVVNRYKILYHRSYMSQY